MSADVLKHGREVYLVELTFEAWLPLRYRADDLSLQSLPRSTRAPFWPALTLRPTSGF